MTGCHDNDSSTVHQALLPNNTLNPLYVCNRMVLMCSWDIVIYVYIYVIWERVYVSTSLPIDVKPIDVKPQSVWHCTLQALESLPKYCCTKKSFVCGFLNEILATACTQYYLCFLRLCHISLFLADLEIFVVEYMVYKRSLVVFVCYRDQ